MGRTLLCGLLLVAFAARAAALDPPAAEDRAVIERCLAEAEKAGRGGETCIGKVADPCLEDPTQVSTAAQARCAHREALVWDERLNRAYRHLQRKDALEQPVQEKLREVQRSWLDFATKKCNFYGPFHQGTMAIPMTAYCDMSERARQALWLAGFCADLATR